MTMLETIMARHSVRAYLTRPIEAEPVERLRQEIIACNEEGKLKLLPYNDTATILYGNPHDFIVGNAVIVGYNDEGESLWLTDEQVCAVVNAVRNAS